MLKLVAIALGIFILFFGLIVIVVLIGGARLEKLQRLDRGDPEKLKW
jgi:hypothetical protein